MHLVMAVCTLFQNATRCKRVTCHWKSNEQCTHLVMAVCTLFQNATRCKRVTCHWKSNEQYTHLVMAVRALIRVQSTKRSACPLPACPYLTCIHRQQRAHPRSTSAFVGHRTHKWQCVPSINARSRLKPGLHNTLAMLRYATNTLRYEGLSYAGNMQYCLWQFICHSSHRCK
jgi:hypothetical protein